MKFPYLRHPLILGALFLTALNDHFLKSQFHNFYTGKISDFTGLFYFPVFLFALIDLFKNPKSPHDSINMKTLFGCVFFTDILFIICKFTDVRVWLMSVFPIQIVRAQTDLMALTVNVVTVIFAAQYKDEDSFI